MAVHARTAFFAALCLLLTSTLGVAQSEPLLTEDDVEGVLGVSVEVDSRGNDGFSFTSSDPVGSITIDPLDAVVFAMMPKNPESAVEGVGDEAFFQLSMINAVVLQVVKGSSGFILSVTYLIGKPTGITDLEDTAVALAKIAAAKL